MNIANRVLVIVLLIMAVIVVTAVSLFPDFFIARFSEVADSLSDIVARMVKPEDNLILIAIGGVIDFLLLLFLALELRRPGAKAVRVQRIEEGTALLTVDSIKQRLSFYIDALEDVVRVRPQVQIQRDKVRVAVDVETTATTNVPAKAQEVVSIIRMVVTETLGLELRGQPKVNIKTRGYKDLVPPAIPTLEPDELHDPAFALPDLDEPPLPALPLPVPEELAPAPPATPVQEEE